MQPLKPSKIAEILKVRPDASPADIQEYERLLAQRFTVNPLIEGAPSARSLAGSAESRLKFLYEKLFGVSQAKPTNDDLEM